MGRMMDWVRACPVWPRVPRAIPTPPLEDYAQVAFDGAAEAARYHCDLHCPARVQLTAERDQARRDHAALGDLLQDAWPQLRGGMAL